MHSSAQSTETPREFDQGALKVRERNSREIIEQDNREAQTEKGEMERFAYEPSAENLARYRELGQNLNEKGAANVRARTEVEQYRLKLEQELHEPLPRSELPGNGPALEGGPGG